MYEVRESCGIHAWRCAGEWRWRTRREGRCACWRWWNGVRDATDAGQRAGCAIWVCGCKAWKVEAWRQEGQRSNACCFGRKLLIDQAFSFVFGLLLFFLLSLAATVT